jgi:ABC-2 type transport system permease protein
MRRLRSRAFILGLLIGAFGIALMLRLPTFIDSFTNQSYRVALAGDPGLIQQARPLLKKDFNISGTMPNLTSPVPRDLERGKKTSAIVVLQRGAHGLRVTVYAKDPGGVSTSQLRRDLLPLNIGSSTRLSESEVATLLKMPIDVRPWGSKFVTAAQADSARLAANVLIFVLYLLIILNAQLIMTSVAEEKTSRIAELLIASVRPSSLLAGKIAASATLAIVQLIVWAVVGFALGADFGSAATPATMDTGPHSGTEAISFSGISTLDIAGFIVFFLIGYLQMATLFAAVGSLINRTEDIGSLGGPLFVPIVAALLIAVTALQVPDAPAIIAASFVPLIAPFVMFARIVVSSVPAWQLALSLAINLAAIYAIAVIGGKIYRIGMLLYGRPPKPIQLWHALRG